MNPRLILIVPLILVAGLLAIVGLRLGYIAATTTETTVINRYAARYLETHGDAANITDCFARPGQERGIWIVVTCKPTDPGDPVVYSYFVNRLGGLERRTGPGDVPGAPELKDRT